MAKQQVKAFLFMELGYDYASDDYRQKWSPTIWKCQVDDSNDRIFIKEIVCEVDVPDDFDPTTRQIAALEKQREEITREFTRSIAQINERISKLQAITYEPEAA